MIKKFLKWFFRVDYKIVEITNSYNNDIEYYVLWRFTPIMWWCKYETYNNIYSFEEAEDLVNRCKRKYNKETKFTFINNKEQYFGDISESEHPRRRSGSMME